MRTLIIGLTPGDGLFYIAVAIVIVGIIWTTR